MTKALAICTFFALSSFEPDVEQELTELKAIKVQIPELSSKEMFDRGRSLYRSKQYDKAAVIFAKLLGKNENLSYRPEIFLMTGITLYNMGKRSEAAVILEKLVKQYPADPRVPEALNWLGKSYSKLAEWEKGVKAFQEILERFPENEWADNALFLMGNIYRDTDNVEKSLECYGRLMEDYPQSKFTDSAIWWKAWSAYTTSDYGQTEQLLGELVKRYPNSFLVHQARYWQGRAAEKLGDISQAAMYYHQVLKRGPYTFYGYRAADRVASMKVLDTAMKAALSEDTDVLCKEGPCSNEPMHAYETDEGPPVWSEETRALLAAEPSFRKTLELLYVDMKKEAAVELWSLQERIPRKLGATIGLSKAFFELGDYHRSYMLVTRKYERYLEAPQGGTPEDLWRLAYPQAYWDHIISHAKKYNQDPYFIAAVMREESQFKSDALSSTGATGSDAGNALNRGVGGTTNKNIGVQQHKTL